MARSLDERAVLRTAQLGLVLAFGSNLVSAAALVVAARALKVNEEYQFVARDAPVEPTAGLVRGAPSLANLGVEEPTEDEAEGEDGQPTVIPATGLAPLTQEQSRIFHGSTEDNAPEQLGGMRDEVYGRHYLASDEWNPHKFYPSIKGSGGGYIGVGTDQAYLFGSWARSELIWAVDYDPMVVDLHQVYADFFAEAKTPAEFMRFWTNEGKKDALKILYQHHPDAADRKPLRVAYLRGRMRVNRRLMLLRDKLTAEQVPSYLTDQEHYDYVRGMFEAGRVRIMLMDLTADSGMRGIATASAKLGIPVRVMYLSNAEQYWKYSPEFRENIAAFDFDDSALVLRTISSRKANGDYRYYAHVARDFQERLKDESIRQVYQFVDLRRIKGRNDIEFTVIGEPPARTAGSPNDPVPAAVGGQE